MGFFKKALKVGAVVGTGGLAAPFLSGQEAEKNQRKATKQTLQIESERNKLERERFAFARQMAQDQWNIYRTQILPIEQQAADLGIEARELALRQGERQANLYNNFFVPLANKIQVEAQRQTEDRTAQVTAQAGAEVSRQFQRQREIEERRLGRFGVRPDSGRFRGRQGTLGLNEASTRVAAINQARFREQDRQDTTNINKLIAASNVIRPFGALPSQGTQISGARAPSVPGAPQLSSAASQNAASQFGQRAADAYGVYGDIASLGVKAYSAGIFG